MHVITEILNFESFLRLPIIEFRNFFSVTRDGWTISSQRLVMTVVHEVKVDFRFPNEIGREFAAKEQT